MENINKMYNVLKEFCENNGKYNRYYYDLFKVQDNYETKCYYDDNKNHRHSYIWSCVYDFCKENNIDELDTLVELFENGYIYEVCSPHCLVHNFRILNKGVI